MHLNEVHPVPVAKNPATTDGRHLELTTRTSHSKEDTITPARSLLGENFDDMPPEDDLPDAPDSPWTIEAVDDEMAEREEVRCCLLLFSFC